MIFLNFPQPRHTINDRNDTDRLYSISELIKLNGHFVVIMQFSLFCWIDPISAGFFANIITILQSQLNYIILYLRTEYIRKLLFTFILVTMLANWTKTNWAIKKIGGRQRNQRKVLFFTLKRTLVGAVSIKAWIDKFCIDSQWSANITFN